MLHVFTRQNTTYETVRSIILVYLSTQVPRYDTRTGHNTSILFLIVSRPAPPRTRAAARSAATIMPAKLPLMQLLLPVLLRGNLVSAQTSFVLENTDVYCGRDEIHRSATDSPEACRSWCVNRPECLGYGTWEQSSCDACVAYSNDCSAPNQLPTSCDGTVSAYSKTMSKTAGGAGGGGQRPAEMGTAMRAKWCGATDWQRWDDCCEGMAAGAIHTEAEVPPITSLEECAAAVIQHCPGMVEYVSFNPEGADCSWYSDCAMVSRPLPGHQPTTSSPSSCYRDPPVRARTCTPCFRSLADRSGRLLVGADCPHRYRPARSARSLHPRAAGSLVGHRLGVEHQRRPAAAARDRRERWNLLGADRE